MNKTIAFYNYKYPYGGGEIVSFNLSKFFHSQGFKVIQITIDLNKEILTDEHSQYVEILELPDKSSETSPSNKKFLIDTIKKYNIEVLLVQGITHFPFESVKEETSCKIIFCIHSKPLWEAEAIRYQRPSEIYRPTFFRKLKFILYRRHIYRMTSKLDKKFIRLYHDIIPYLDKLVFLAPEYEQDFSKMLNKKGFGGKQDLYRGKLASVLNPLLPKNPDAVSEKKEKTVIYVGRLTHEPKRVDRLLKIWKSIESKHSDWKLIIIGDGPEQNNLTDLCEQLNLKNVEFTGYLSNIDSYYKRARIICLTSNFEGLPMCLMEAQQFGVIPCSFDSYSGIHTIIENGKSGIAVKAFSLKLYAEKLLALMENEELQHQMHTNCIKASQRYDLNKIGEEWLQLIKSL